MSVAEAAAIAKDAEDKAMAIDPMNARTQLIAGIKAMYFDWDMPKAEKHILRSIELNPNFYEAHFMLGWFRLVMQQFDKMDEPLQAAYRLDPIGGETVPGLGEVYFFKGDLNLSLKYCEEGIRNYPDSMYANSMKALVVGAKGDWPQALSIFGRYR